MHYDSPIPLKKCSPDSNQQLNSNKKHPTPNIKQRKTTGYLRAMLGKYPVV